MGDCRNDLEISRIHLLGSSELVRIRVVIYKYIRDEQYNNKRTS